MGKGDPVLLSGGIQLSKRLASIILAGERRQVSRAIWLGLFAFPPTHVIRFGWKSFSTGKCHDIFYLPLCFRFPGFNTEGLAENFGEYLLEQITRNRDPANLCPSAKNLHNVQVFWLAVGFVRHQWSVTDER